MGTGVGDPVAAGGFAASFCIGRVRVPAQTKVILAALASRTLDDLGAVFGRLAPGAEAGLVDAIAAARRIAVYGAGREGLQMDGLGMRLFQLGLDAHVVGEMTAPPLGPGDLLVVSSGSGASNIGDALIEAARAAGARIAVVTAQPRGRTPSRADVVSMFPPRRRPTITASRFWRRPRGRCSKSRK